MRVRMVSSPLQSGDDTILTRMKRPYTTQRFKELVTRIHDLSPTAAVGADVIVGFPGETDTQFENTCRLLESLPLAYLHVFPFSPRERTPAATFDGRIDGETMKHRTARVRAIGDAAKSRFMKAAVGSRAVVLVEKERDRKTGLLKGVTSNYIHVQLQGEDHLMNQLVPVFLEANSDKDYLNGRREEL